MRLTVAAGLMALAVAGGAQAQGFSGAELSAEIGARTGDFDLGHTVYSGGASFAITPSIGIGADFTHYGLRGLDGEGSGYSLHGNYRLSNGLTAGLFLGRDTLDGADYDFAGIEGAAEISGVAVQGYAGQYAGAAEGGLMGASASFDLGRAFAVTGSFDAVSGDAEASRLALGAAYRLGNGPEVFAELGTLSDEGEGSSFVTLGARIGLGPNGGTAFDARGVLQSLGGF